MKHTLLAAAILLSITTAQATEAGFTGSSAVQGAIKNNVSATSSVLNGVGSSNSYAGSSSSAAATAVLGATNTFSNKDCVIKSTGTPTLSGTTDTSTFGQAFNNSTGVGTGAAAASGYADAGSNGQINTIIHGTNSFLNISGSSDSGFPNRANGTDVAVSAGTNQGGAFSAVSGGEYKATGVLSYESGNGKIAGSVSDTKSASTYAQTVKYTIPGFVEAGGTYVNATVLNASSVANAAAEGGFSITNTTVPNVRK